MSVSSSELTQAGKYIIFGIADDLYGLEVDNLKEVFQTEKILKLPRTSDILAGIVNLRGVIISVFDLSMLLWGKESRLRSEQEIKDDSGLTMNILLITIKEQDVGILVDRIHHLGELTSIKSMTSAEMKEKKFLNSSFITKVGYIEDDKAVFILDLAGILTGYVSSPKPQLALQDDEVLDFDFSQYTLPEQEESLEPEKTAIVETDSESDIEILKLPEDEQEVIDNFDFEKETTTKKKETTTKKKGKSKKKKQKTKKKKETPTEKKETPTEKKETPTEKKETPTEKKETPTEKKEKSKKKEKSE